MNKRKLTKGTLATFVTGIYGYATYKTSQQVGAPRPPVDQELIKKMVIGGAVMSGIAWALASL